MKMRPEDFAELSRLVKAGAALVPTEAEYLASGMSAGRFKWDALHAGGGTPWVCDKLYRYLNDMHISTALKHIEVTP